MTCTLKLDVFQNSKMFLKTCLKVANLDKNWQNDDDSIKNVLIGDENLTVVGVAVVEENDVKRLL